MNKIIIPQAQTNVQSILKNIFVITTPLILIVLAVLSAPLVKEYPMETIVLLTFTSYVSIPFFMFYLKIGIAPEIDKNSLDKKVNEYVLAKLQEAGQTIVIDGKHYANISKIAYKQLFWKFYPKVKENEEAFLKKGTFLDELTLAMKSTWEKDTLVIPYRIADLLFVVYYILVYCIKGTVSIDFLMIGIIGAMLSFMGIYRIYWNQKRTLRYRVLCDMCDAVKIPKQLFLVNREDSKSATIPHIGGQILFQSNSGKLMGENIIIKAGKFFNYYVFRNTIVEHNDLRIFAYSKD